MIEHREHVHSERRPQEHVQHARERRGDQTKEYDAIIIGAGQSGGPLSQALAAAGKRVAIIERKHVGGTCVNEGCTPSKTMVASAEVAHLVRTASDYGVNTGNVSVDLKRVRLRKQEVVLSFRNSSHTHIIETDGVDLYQGTGAFVAPYTIRVDLVDGGEEVLAAPRIFINTGGRPAWPNIPGLEKIQAFDSTSIMELERVPERLIVLGGGSTGLEFAQMFQRFGSEVTVVQRAPQLLRGEDQDIAEAVAEILRDDGIEVLLSTSPVRVEPAGDGEAVMVVKGSGGERTLEPGHLLLATGRTPNTDRLNLEAAGVEMDERGYVGVNDRLETNVPGIYALGDVNGGPAFTHISYDDYRIVKENLLGKGGASRAGRMLPYTVFIDPQLGRVGVTEEEARRQGLNFCVARLPMTAVNRAVEVSNTRGMMKAIVDPESGLILGCSILGVDGGEIMAIVQVAMMGKVHYSMLRDAVFAHPTVAEAMNNLFANLE